MLKRIHIESYRTLRNTTVSFRDGLNIIIGQNGVGKSNLLGFISSFTRSSITRRLFQFGNLKGLNSNYSFYLASKNAAGADVEIIISIERNKSVTSKDDDLPFGIHVTKKVAGQDPEIISLMDIDRRKSNDINRDVRNAEPFNGTYITFSIPAELPYLLTPSTLTIDIDSGVQIEFSNPIRFLNQFEFLFEDLISDKAGMGILNDIPLIKNHVISAFDQAINAYGINEHLSSYTNIEKIRLSNNLNIYSTDTDTLIENLVLEFLIDGAWMPWSYLSDGTKRSFYLIAQVAAARNELILIEEPELGLHPFQLHKIMTFLKEQSETKQIIISTHAPAALDVLGPDELDQILVATIQKGVTSFQRLTEEQEEKARRYMSEVGDLSSYWLHSDLEAHD